MKHDKKKKRVYTLTISPHGESLRKIRVVKSVAKHAGTTHPTTYRWSPKTASEWLTISEAAAKLDVYSSSLYHHTTRLAPWLDRNSRNEVVLHRDALTAPCNQDAFRAAQINRSMATHKRAEQNERQLARSRRYQEQRKNNIEAKIAAAVADATRESKRQNDVVADWLPAQQLRYEYHIPIHRLYESHDMLKKYISKPDGFHYLYHKSLLNDGPLMQYLTRPRREVGVPPSDNNTSKSEAVKESNGEPVAATVTGTKDEPTIDAVQAPPIKVNRKVYCKELYRTFNSITDAAKAIGVRRESLSKALRAGQRCHGYTFEYVDEESGLPMWNSLYDIAKAIGVSSCSVHSRKDKLPTGMVVQQEKATLYHRDIVKLPLWEQVKKNRELNRPQPIYIKELDQTMKTLTAAAKKLHCSSTDIHNAIKEGVTCKGYTLSYA